jgi:hypothetical protein
MSTEFSPSDVLLGMLALGIEIRIGEREIQVKGFQGSPTVVVLKSLKNSKKSFSSLLFHDLQILKLFID